MDSGPSHSHTLEYSLTEASGDPNIPEFVGVATVDDDQILHYNTKTGTAEPKQEWMKKVSPYDLCTERTDFLHKRQIVKAFFNTSKLRFNQTEGGHVYKWTFGCRCHDETGVIDGFDRHVYDGKDLVSFNLKKKIYSAATQQANIFKDEMNQDKEWIEHQAIFLTRTCPGRLKKYVDHRRSSLMRTELLSVSPLQKSPSSPGGKEILTVLDRDQIRTNGSKEENPAETPSHALIFAPLAAFLIAIVLAIAGFIIRKKRGVKKALKSTWKNPVRPEQQELQQQQEHPWMNL